MNVGGKVKGAGNYTGHHVQVSFTEKAIVSTAEDQFIWRAAQDRVPILSDGRFLFELPNKDHLKNGLKFEVLAPDGEILKTKEFNVDDIIESNDIIIEVDAKRYFEIPQNDDPSLGRRMKISGRVIDEAGKQKISYRQVVLLGSPLSNGGTSGGTIVPFVLAVTRTDKEGYFSEEYPKGQYKEAFGVVSIEKNYTVPIHLEADKSFPKKVILVVRLDEGTIVGNGDAEEKSCTGCDVETPRTPDNDDLTNSPSSYSTDLGGGRCVDFTTPNRALEEFNYYKVVRTTEPEIKGITFTDGRKLPPWIVDFVSKSDLFNNPKTAMMRRIPTADGERPVVGKVDLSKALTKLSPQDFKELMKRPENFDPNVLVDAAVASEAQLIQGIINEVTETPPSRTRLSATNPVDWDNEPTIYQATSIAHGHILHFKQVWKADGYSMGDLVYSLPLAPCQKKQIAIIDWDRREVASRKELLEEEERLANVLSRDRDVSEITNALLTENLKGGSRATTFGFSEGFGLSAIIPPVSGLMGAAGGVGYAGSSAWQNSARELTGNSLQELHDKTSQAASAVRSQRSTVVQAVEQGESMKVQTEVVTNHNHCHAITMEYFQVLRHLLVSQELSDVQECLFVPLLISKFDLPKILRWNQSLRIFLRDRTLTKGFDAVERIQNHYEGSDLPLGRYSEDTIEDIDGELRILMNIARPKDYEDGSFYEDMWSALVGGGSALSLLWTSPSAIYSLLLGGKTQAEKDKIFRTQIAPRIAEKFIQNLRFLVSDGTTDKEIALDSTLVSKYAEGPELYVSLRTRGPFNVGNRENIKYFRIISRYDLPQYSKVTVQSGSIRYRTKYFSHFLFNNSRILNDLSVTDGVTVYTPIDREELRNPRQEDIELSRKLKTHLNENIEYYHRSIWLNMDKERRYMLLDGFEAPNSSGKSVASVVENRLIGIVGNSLVLPVTVGVHLDPTYQQNIENPLDLLNLYAPDTPIPPMRLTIPTKGVYAEAVMGSCNSCEKKDDSRFWKFEESPCGDEPTAIMPVSTESRRAEPGDLKPQPFPTPIINLQNAPAVPDPTGLGAAFGLLGTPNLFRDITGLEQNQKNALAALNTTMEAAKSFGSEAAKLAQQKEIKDEYDRTADRIKKALDDGLITKDDASKLTNSALRGLIGENRDQPKTKLSQEPSLKKVIESGADPGNSIEVVSDNESIKKTSTAADEGVITIDLLKNNSPLAKSFFPDISASPGSGDISGHTRLEATVSNSPSGVKFRWSASRPSAVQFTDEGELTTEVIAMEPGLVEVNFEVIESSSGRVLKKATTLLSVPQFIKIEQTSSFDDVLTDLHIIDDKEKLLGKVKSVVNLLTSSSNIRIIWKMQMVTDLFNQLPAAFDDGTKEGKNVSNFILTGVNENFDEYPKGRSLHESGPSIYCEVNGYNLNNLLEPGGTLAENIIKINQSIAANPNDSGLKDLMVESVSRIMAVMISRWILYSLLGKQTFTDEGFNKVPIPGDIFNHPNIKGWEGFTGIRVLDPNSFPQIGTYVDDGIGAISKLTPTSQSKIDRYFPVPPAMT
jgi:hypothetical protein